MLRDMKFIQTPTCVARAGVPLANRPFLTMETSAMNTTETMPTTPTVPGEQETQKQLLQTLVTLVETLSARHKAIDIGAEDDADEYRGGTGLLERARRRQRGPAEVPAVPATRPHGGKHRRVHSEIEATASRPARGVGAAAAAAGGAQGRRLRQRRRPRRPSARQVADRRHPADRAPRAARAEPLAAWRDEGTRFAGEPGAESALHVGIPVREQPRRVAGLGSRRGGTRSRATRRASGSGP